MRRRRPISRKKEKGIVIILVAIVLLFVVGAMAALAIDVVTFYTARSEAQLAADGAALAAARVLANSGITSDSPTDPNYTTLVANTVSLATNVATQVASNNPVGGKKLSGGACPGAEICVSFNETNPVFAANPRVTVQVQRTDLPTFFARIWGTTAITVTAKAIAEAYNPSNAVASLIGGVVPRPPVAPACVKPWLLPNVDPTSGAIPPGRIFDPTNGTIQNAGLLGQPDPRTFPPPFRLRNACFNAPGDCSDKPAPSPWMYYPGATDAADFNPPIPSSVTCPACATPYQLAVAGCVQTPIACNTTVDIDLTAYPLRDPDTGVAVDALTHTSGNAGDRVDTTGTYPDPPFQSLTGDDNPVVQAGAIAGGTDVAISDSLVTVPVINADATSGLPPSFPTVQIIGFVQLFLNSGGHASPANGHLRTMVVNMIGCGTSGASGQPILGSGASAIPVRLISP